MQPLSTYCVHPWGEDRLQQYIPGSLRPRLEQGFFRKFYHVTTCMGGGEATSQLCFVFYSFDFLCFETRYLYAAQASLEFEALL